MDIQRRHFIKGLAASSVPLLALVGIGSAAKAGQTHKALASATDAHIEKSIKASFGGGFSLRSHTQSGGLTYADIEHCGNRRAVASADLLDWKIVRSAEV